MMPHWTGANAFLAHLEERHFGRVEVIGSNPIVGSLCQYGTEVDSACLVSRNFMTTQVRILLLAQLTTNLMTTNEIKKALYKEKLTAIMDYVTNGAVWYTVKLNDGTDVFFKVPAEETFGGTFYPTMSAQQLIRWIYQEEENDQIVEDDMCDVARRPYTSG
jgi:hypothetical protein